MLIDINIECSKTIHISFITKQPTTLTTVGSVAHLILTHPLRPGVVNTSHWHNQQGQVWWTPHSDTTTKASVAHLTMTHPPRPGLVHTSHWHNQQGQVWWTPHTDTANEARL